MAGGSNLYDIFDQPSHNSLANENHLTDANGEMKLDGGISLSASSAFDTMLEMLPDTADFSFFTHGNGSETPRNSSNANSRSNSRKGSLFPDQMGQSVQANAHMHNGFDSVFNGTTTTKGINENGAGAQPIEIANQQNGEITQLWDFNVDEFMMTPEGSNSATISAPNSFNSEGQYHPGSASGMPLMSMSSINSQNDHLDHGLTMSNNFSQFLTMGIQFPAQNTSTLFNRSESSSPRNNGSQTTLKKDEFTTLYRPPLNGRRSSTQLSKSVHAEDGGIFLSSTNVSNSVRKNSLGRQMSSSSLSSYKRGPTSMIPEMQKKPSLLCFNCKTQKTPLWRRDSHGNTLCNACGLFQKLHGTMRPLSLKTDVIKKRNNRKRAKKLQEQAEKGGGTNSGKKGPNGSEKKGSGAATPGTITKNPRLRRKASQPSNINTMATDSSLSLAESQESANLDLRMSYNQASTTYSSNNNESLNSNNLTTHNKKTSNLPIARKPRRDSTSSSNSCSSRSSSRSVVPILPKPSPSIGNQTFSIGVNTSVSAGNSAASSPRVVGPSFNAASPMTSSQSAFSTSTGRQAITIPRRKLSRNHSSSSSSFMAASLQQLQQQNQQQQQQPQQQSFNASVSQSNNWNLPSNGASPTTTRSPKAGFELFNSPSDSPGIPSSRKSQTSLLSQQLQNSGSSQHSQKQNNGEVTGNGYHQSPVAHSPQSLSFKRSSVTASPRNSYADSVMQHRGLHDSNLTLRRQSSLGLRRNAQSKDQLLSPNAEMGGVSSTHASTVTTPTISASVTPVTATAGNDRSTPGLHSNISDELDWLKFGM